MARIARTNLRALFGALAVALAPQTGLAELGDVDLSDVRKTLRSIQAELEAGLDGPANVAAYWAKLPILDTKATDPAEETTAPFTSGTAFLGSANVIPAPVATAPQAKTDGGGLFSLQNSQAVTIAPEPRIAPLPAPAFGSLAPFGAPKPQGQATASARVVPQDVDTANFRLMLATLSQTYTGENATAVVNAQGPRGPIAVSIRAGTVTLADVQSYAAALGFPPRQDGTMTVPVIIWPGATLRLSAGERMALARDAGAFVLAMGTLEVEGATIEVAGTENPHTPSFMPFVTIASGGSLTLKNATLRGLGFGQTAKFSGLSVAGNLLTQSRGKVVIQDSLFDGLKNLTLAGVSGAKVTGNTFANARDNTLSLINAPKSLIENNIFADGSHTNAIRVDVGSSDTRISNNIFLSGKRVAMLITGGSDRVQVIDNLVWKREGAGIKFFKTRCGLAQGNVIMDNRQKGIEVRKSNGTVVRDNLIANNGSAGIWVSAQSPNARTALSANVLVANSSGVTAATGAEIYMQGNNLKRQLPRLLDGDIARLSHSVATDLAGVSTLRLKDGRVEQGIDMMNLCGGDL